MIIVSSTLELAGKGRGELWDSGRVTSAETGISFQGLSLRSCQRCYWRVQWWDKRERQSDLSEVASFEMGLLRQADWAGIWISKQEHQEFTTKGTVLLGEYLGDTINTYGVYGRREFQLSRSVSLARAYACGLGYYELRINGTRVGDRMLDPAQTDYARRALYSTYDITAILRGAETRDQSPAFAVGVLLGNGRHIRNYGYGPTAL